MPAVTQPSASALQAVRRLAGPQATIGRVTQLRGGQHASTWRVDTAQPATTVAVREFPAGDPAPQREREILTAIDGLGGLAPRLLAADLDGCWSPRPALITSWLPGAPDITPADPDAWAAQLGIALARVHERSGGRLPSVLARPETAADALAGPAAPLVAERLPALAAAPQRLAHNDYWSGNTVFAGPRLTGIVDWSSASRGPREWDLGWVRLDLALLFDDARLSDVLHAAYEDAAGATADPLLADAWALARSHHGVTSWDLNYIALGRTDLDAPTLARRHAEFTALTVQRYNTSV